jgi:subtilisin-like proprotein convertase family protein
MNKQITLGLLTVLLTAASARATLYTEIFTPGTAIPDGSPVGTALTGTVSDIPAGATVTGLTVGLNITGGYNGDLYAYLVAPNGAMVVLLNRPGVSVNGFGASGAGMNITLQDGTTDRGTIQNETGASALSGSYNAAGSLAGFNGSLANGTWTLFFADLGSGGGTSTLNSWTLGITAVPEPVNVALGLFGGTLAVMALARYFRATRCSV